VHDGSYDLAIRHIHLATICLDVKFLH
jgi:hypothetical protein